MSSTIAIPVCCLNSNSATKCDPMILRTNISGEVGGVLLGDADPWVAHCDRNLCKAPEDNRGQIVFDKVLVVNSCTNVVARCPASSLSRIFNNEYIDLRQWSLILLQVNVSMQCQAAQCNARHESDADFCNSGQTSCLKT